VSQAPEQTIEEALDALANLRALRDKLRLEQAELEDQVTPVAVKKALADIETEYAGRLAVAEEAIASAESAIKARAVAEGHSATGQRLSVVYYKGRVTWETAHLEALEAIYPGLSKLKKVGEPYGVITPVKKGSK